MPTFYKGSAGRVIVGSTAVAGLTNWKLDKTATFADVTNFESTADGNGLVWEELVQGIGSASGSAEGRFATSAAGTLNSEQCFPIGTQVTLDLILNESTTVGYIDLPAFITTISPSQTLSDAASFSFGFKVNGVPAVANA